MARVTAPYEQQLPSGKAIDGLLILGLFEKQAVGGLSPKHVKHASTNLSLTWFSTEDSNRDGSSESATPQPVHRYHWLSNNHPSKFGTNRCDG